MDQKRKKEEIEQMYLGENIDIKEKLTNIKILPVSNIPVLSHHL